MSVLTNIADAVVAELNDHDFGVQFTAERVYDPALEIRELKDLRVTVVPKGAETQTASRSLVQHDYRVDVAVRKKFDADSSAELDPLIDLVEAIGDFFKQRRLQSMPNAAWVRTENPSAWSPEHLSEQRVFVSVLTFTFRVLR